MMKATHAITILASAVDYWGHYAKLEDSPKIFSKTEPAPQMLL